MKHLFVFSFMVLILCVSCNSIAQDLPTINYPKIQGLEVAFDTINDVVIEDRFRVLENDTIPEILDWIAKEDSLTKTHVEGLPLFNVLNARLEELDKVQENNPYFVKSFTEDYTFYVKYIGAESTTNIYRSSKAGDEPINTLFRSSDYKPEGNTVYYITHYQPSWDGNYLAVALNSSSALGDHILVIDSKTGERLGGVLKNGSPGLFGGVRWLPDSSGFMYTYFPVVDVKKEGYKENSFTNLHLLTDEKPRIRKVLKNISSDETLVFPQVKITSDKAQYALGFMSTSNDYYDVYYKKWGGLSKESEKWEKILSISDKALWDNVEIKGDTVYFIRNLNKENYGLSYKLLTDRTSSIKDMFIPQAGETVDEFKIAGDVIYFSTTKNGIEGSIYSNEKSGSFKKLELPKKAGTISLMSNISSSSKISAQLQGWTYPSLRYEYMGENVWAQDTIIKNVYSNFSKFEVIETEYESHDGVMVPISIIRNSKKQSETSPPVIFAYGSFGSSLTPRFTKAHLSWVENGGIWTYVHIRGGGEKGPNWHADGSKKNKVNSWKDLIWAAKFLSTPNFANDTKPVLFVGSGGAIAGGMAINEAPELFSAFIAKVPVLNPLRLQFGSIPNQYQDEYGDINNSNESEWLYKMDPYANLVKGKNYPSTLVVISGKDDRLNLWQGTKYIASLQEKSGSKNPHLLMVDWNGTHSSSVDANEIFAKMFSWAEQQSKKID